MDELYRLAMEDAPLRKLVLAAAQTLETDYAVLINEKGRVLCSVGEPAGQEIAYALEWERTPVGTLRIGTVIPVPEAILRLFSGELYLLKKAKPYLNAALWEAFDNEHSKERCACVNESLLLNTEGRTYLLLYVDTNALDEMNWPRFYEALQREMPMAAVASAFDNEGLAVLFWMEDYAESDALSAALLKKLTQHSVTGALSMPFDGRRLKEQMELLRLVLHAGTRLYPDQLFFRFERFASFTLFLAVQKSMRLANYYSEEVLEIIQHDYEKGTELARSLYVYLFYFMDIKAAAADVRVHRNTLDYQLKKIGQILEGLPEVSKSFEMMCTYGMLAMEEVD